MQPQKSGHFFTETNTHCSVENFGGYRNIKTVKYSKRKFLKQCAC